MPQADDSILKTTLLRAVNTHPPEARARRFVDIALSRAQQAKLNSAKDALLYKFPRIAAPDPRDAIMTAIGTFYDTSPNKIANLDDLYTTFKSPVVDAMYFFVNSAEDLAKLDSKALRGILEKVLGTTLEEYALNDAQTDTDEKFDIDKLRLWDNLVGSYFKFSDPSIEETREEVIKLIRVFWMLERFQTLKTGQDIREATTATVIIPDSITKMIQKFSHDRPRFNCAMANVKIVRTKLLKYDTGEVAHIENILKGESKNSSLRVLNRLEETTHKEQETTTYAEKDVQTADRLELNQEVSKVQNEDMKFNTALSVNAKVGPVDINSSMGFAYTQSKEESTKSATKQAKEIVSRALSRVTERVQSQRSIVSVSETEKSASHDFDNSDGTDNIAGVYQWVDKYYVAKVIDYGVRLMIDLIIPDPAAKYLFANAARAATKTSATLVSPDTIKVPGTNKGIWDLVPSDFGYPNPANAAFRVGGNVNHFDAARAFGAKVVPPSQYKKAYGLALSGVTGEPPTGNLKTIESSALVVEAGYEAKTAKVILSMIDHQDGNHGDVDQNKYCHGSVGSARFAFFHLQNDSSTLIFKRQLPDGKIPNPIFELQMNGDTGTIPISAIADTPRVTIGVTVNCELTQDAFVKWQVESYNAVLDGYLALKQDYEKRLSQQTGDASAAALGHKPTGNPDINREIEQREIKECCLQLLTRGKYLGTFDDVEPGALPNPAAIPPKPLVYPKIKAAQMALDAKVIQFFEQAFDWNLLSYRFLPYFWLNASQWLDKMGMEDPDPVFQNFLRAGAARVLLPVRLRYEEMVKYYFDTGAIWNGGNPPVPDEPLWISIADEMKEDSGIYKEARVDGPPWIIKMPTTLVYLRSLDPAAKVNLPDNTSQFEYTPEAWREMWDDVMN